MSPRRGDRAAPPPTRNEWDIRFATSEAAKGWQELERAATGNLRWAWDLMRAERGPGAGKPNSRHFPLKGHLATGCVSGRVLPQWEIEVTGGGRLLDVDRRTVWVKVATTGHPKETE